MKVLTASGSWSLGLSHWGSLSIRRGANKKNNMCDATTVKFLIQVRSTSRKAVRTPRANSNTSRALAYIWPDWVIVTATVMCRQLFTHTWEQNSTSLAQNVNSFLNPRPAVTWYYLACKYINLYSCIGSHCDTSSGHTLPAQDSDLRSRFLRELKFIKVGSSCQKPSRAWWVWAHEEKWKFHYCIRNWNNHSVTPIRMHNGFVP